MENNKKFKVVPFGNRRFAIADTETGEILDNAQGYGYKTAQNAYRAAYYKENSGPLNSENRKVIKFMKENKSFADDVETAMFYALKDGEKMTESDLNEIARNNNVTLPFDAKKFLGILNRKSCKW